VDEAPGAHRIEGGKRSCQKLNEYKPGLPSRYAMARFHSLCRDTSLEVGLETP
jgi:hypothetical protein